MLEGNPADPNSVSGMFLFEQWGEDARIKVLGRVDLGADGEDVRALAVTENSYDGLDCGLNGDIFNPFTPEEDYESLRDMVFGADGVGYYEHRDCKTTLFGDNSIIGRSVSMFEMEEQAGFIDACCTIESISFEQFFEARKELDSDQDDERRLQEEAASSDDDSTDSADEEGSPASESSESSVSSESESSESEESSESNDERRLQEEASSAESVESEESLDEASADSVSSESEEKAPKVPKEDRVKSDSSADDVSSDSSSEDEGAEGTRRLRSRA